MYEVQIVLMSVYNTPLFSSSSCAGEKNDNTLKLIAELQRPEGPQSGAPYL